MKTKFNKTGALARTPRATAGKFNPTITINPKIPGRAFDAVAYAAALEVLG